MMPDEHNPEGVDHAAQGHALAASKPAPALPQEVRQVIARILHCWEALPHPGVGTNQICAALAPLWPRPAPVTADTRELWERAFDAYCNGMGDATSHERAAAVLAPVVRERDQLRAEVVRLERDAYLGDDDEKRHLRAEFEKLTTVAAQTADRNTDLRAEVERLQRLNIDAVRSFDSRDEEITDLRAQLAASPTQRLNDSTTQRPNP